MNTNRTRIFGPVPVRKLAGIWFAALAVAVVAPVAWLLVWLLRTPAIRYEVAGGRLTITSALGSERNRTAIDLAAIATATPEWLRGGRLRFGTEKPGYCVGFFAYPRVGEVWLVSDCSAQAVVLTSSAEATPVAITPADRGGFLRALHDGGPAVFAPPGHRGVGWWVDVLTVAVVGVAALAALALVLFVAPARLHYAVDGGMLTVATLLHRRSVPLAGARARPHRPLAGPRLAGLPLPGYRVGSWMLDAMATAVVASAADDGVLIEGEGRLFVNPQDRDGFLAALAAEGAVIDTDTLRRR